MKAVSLNFIHVLLYYRILSYVSFILLIKPPYMDGGKEDGHLITDLVLERRLKLRFFG